MTDSVPGRGTDVAGTSVGDLVAQAVGDVSQLIKCELDLAKLEMKNDARRLGMAGALIGAALFTGCLVLVLLCFAYAYGLQAAGVWPWAAFLIAAGTAIVFAALATFIALTKFRGLTGLRRTRQTVTDDLALIRREDRPAGGRKGRGR